MYAISYDEVDALTDFADAHEVAYPLLSDPDSETIRRFGILNTLIPPSDTPWYGIPFPGTYVIGAAGTVTAKFFEHSLAIRPGPEQLLRAALGGEVVMGPPPEPVEEVEVRAALDGDTLSPGITRELLVDVQVPDGLHIYGEPVPSGMVATSVELDSIDTVIAREVVTPRTSPHKLSSGEELSIYEGLARFRVPLTITNVVGSDSLTVTGRVRYQCCNDDECFLPTALEFSVDVPVEPYVVGDLTKFGQAGPRSKPMNGMEHMAKMYERNGKEPPETLTR